MDPRIMQQNPWLIATSIAFLAAFLYALRKGATTLAISLFAIIAASSLYHATKDPIIFWIDQAAVFGLLIASIVYTYHQFAWHGIAIVIAAVAILSYLYYYGWYTKSMIWSERFDEATTTHAFMHILVNSGLCGLLYCAL